MLFAGEPAGALVCGAVAVASGGWENLRGRFPSGPARRPVSLWAAALVGHPAIVRGWRNRRAKFLLRAACQPRATRAWLARLGAPEARPLWLARPRLTSKLQRPYLRRDWGLAERLAALTSHYDTLGELLAPAARSRVYSEGLTLVRLTLPGSGRRVDLRLVYRDQFEKEGDLTITVEDVASRLLLAALTFCLCQEGRRRTAWIGGMQASADPRTRTLITEVARELHGLRPKALALWALRQFAPAWGIAQLCAAGDAEHVHRHWHRRSEPEVNYNEFWAESGGRLRAAGGWELPLVVPRRRREEIKPSRRKAYERRYSMLAELRPELLAAYSAVTPAAGPEEAEALPRSFEG